jgi:hypothetical protein
MKIVHFEFLEQAQTVNQHCYFEILATLHEAVCQRRPVLWPDAWILHCDNALAHDVDNEIGPSTIFARFGPVRLLAIPKTEDRSEGP